MVPKAIKAILMSASPTSTVHLFDFLSDDLPDISTQKKSTGIAKFICDKCKQRCPLASLRHDLPFTLNFKHAANLWQVHTPAGHHVHINQYVKK